jgi:tRNA dimethylallyltransferase
MSQKPHIVAVIGPTASGKSAKAVALAKERNGEVISVDSRQVYRTLDIGTEKTSLEEMQGVPHHLIDIRDPETAYNAGDFADDAHALIEKLIAEGKTPILAGGTHFYFDALLYGLPGEPIHPELRTKLEARTNEDLFAELQTKDPRRAERIDPQNKRRLVRALEIVETHGSVPERERSEPAYEVEWVIIDLPKEELRARIDTRLAQALERGLIQEVERTRARVGDARLNELGLEYRVIGEFLRGERSEASLLPTLSSRLWRYARQQKQWLKRLDSFQKNNTATN